MNRVAAALVVMAVLSALSSLGTLVVAVSVVLLDPTLLVGQGGLALSVTAVLVVLGIIATMLPTLAAVATRSGQPAGRILGTVVAVAWLATPLLPVGAYVLYALWGDAETAAWFAVKRCVDAESAGS